VTYEQLISVQILRQAWYWIRHGWWWHAADDQT